MHTAHLMESGAYGRLEHPRHHTISYIKGNFYKKITNDLM